MGCYKMNEQFKHEMALRDNCGALMGLMKEANDEGRLTARDGHQTAFNTMFARYQKSLDDLSDDDLADFRALYAIPGHSI